RHWLALGLAVALVGLAIGLQFVNRAPAVPEARSGALYVVDQSTVLALRGDVQLQRVGATKFEPLTGQAPLQVGDRVRTGADGYASLVYFDGSATSLSPDTEVVLQRFERDPANGATAVIVQQPLGTTWTVAAETGHPFSGLLLVNAAGRFFARGAQFLANVTPEGTTTVEPEEGSVFGRAANTDVEVPARFSTRVHVGEAPEPPVPAPLPPTTLQVRVEGPVRALLTDAHGRSIGRHPQAEPLVSQIPQARLVPGDGNTQIFSVPGPVESYTLTLGGTGTGEVSVAVGTLRAGERAAPAAALVAGQIAAGETQTTAFQWLDGQVRDLRALAPAPGTPPDSAVVVLRSPPPLVAVAPTAAPTELAQAEPDAEAEADARLAIVEPDASDVFSSFEAPVAVQRPSVVAPAPPPSRPVLSQPAPPPPPQAPPRPPVVAQAPPTVVRAAPTEDVEPPTPTRPAPTATVAVVVVTATPLPPTPLPPTPVPPTPRPPTPVPPTAEPTVPPPLPTPVPTVAPTRGAAPRAPVQAAPQPQRPAIAPTATPIIATAAPVAPTRCPYPSC
ncbi:MAG TPA: hypothetical protein VFE37_13545, partial [Chloroflexota bacterium]|nr:hypothetical protein [Chloroflexota bacterium]